MAIDEVRRAPDLLFAIKQVVDLDSTPDRFLITGSADIVTHLRIADALPGRVDYMTLWPFSQKAGSRKLRDRLGERFRRGFVLHLGSTQLPMGDRISAVPLAALWA